MNFKQRAHILHFGMGFAALVLCVFLAGCQGSGQKLKFQNVILLSLDDLRADRLGIYGQSRALSPTMDSLGKNGAFISHAYTPYPFTPPSHTTMLTSLYPTVFDIPLDEKVQTLASYLSANGIHTKAVTGGGYMSADYGALNGFDEYDDEVYRLPKMKENISSFFKEYKDKRFFLFLHSFYVHLPFVAPPEEFQKLADPDYDGPIKNDGTSTRIFTDKVNGKQIIPTPGDIRRLFDLYDAQVPEADRFIKFLVEEMNKHGLSEKTLLIITSDHGEQFYEFGYFAHSSIERRFAEVSTHVPLIFSSPALPAVGKLEIKAELVDIAPTICASVGLPSPSIFQGQSLLPLITKRHPVDSWKKDRIFYATDWRDRDKNGPIQTCLLQRQGNHEFVRSEKDPEEETDFAGDPSYADILKSLLERLYQQMERNAALRNTLGLTQIRLADEKEKPPLSFDRYSLFLLSFEKPYYISGKRDPAQTREVRRISPSGTERLPLTGFKPMGFSCQAEILQEIGSIDFWITIDSKLEWKQDLMNIEWIKPDDIVGFRLFHAENTRYGIEINRTINKETTAPFKLMYRKEKERHHVFIGWTAEEIYFLINGNLIARQKVDTSSLLRQNRTNKIRLSGEKLPPGRIPGIRRPPPQHHDRCRGRKGQRKSPRASSCTWIHQMKKIFISFLLISLTACAKTGQTEMTFQTQFLQISLDAKGFIISMRDKQTENEYVGRTEPSPLLTLQIGRQDDDSAKSGLFFRNRAHLARIRARFQCGRPGDGENQSSCL